MIGDQDGSHAAGGLGFVEKAECGGKPPTTPTPSRRLIVLSGKIVEWKLPTGKSEG